MAERKEAVELLDQCMHLLTNESTADREQPGWILCAFDNNVSLA